MGACGEELEWGHGRRIEDEVLAGTKKVKNFHLPSIYETLHHNTLVYIKVST